MAETVDRQPSSSGTSEATSVEKREHEEERFAHWEEELARQDRASKLKVRIISALIGVGIIGWAWAAMH